MTAPEILEGQGQLFELAEPHMGYDVAPVMPIRPTTTTEPSEPISVADYLARKAEEARQ